MITITEEQLLKYIDWHGLGKTIDTVVRQNDFVQPIKPYLRYGDPKNRIIAMPAYVGGDIQCSGIKWISSFPDNIHKGIPRAHCIVVLNDPTTGVPIAMINDPLISVIRTTAVTSWMIVSLVGATEKMPKKIGIIGHGPIGRMHSIMLKSIFKTAEQFIYDVDPSKRNVETWQEAYRDMDIVITSTVSPTRYIDRLPKQGAWLMNVSLRDYEPTRDLYYTTDHVIVDSWDEINRENTDIEQLNEVVNGRLEDTHKTIFDLEGMNIKPTDTVFFNPMGMAAFDIAVSKYFYDKVVLNGQ